MNNDDNLDLLDLDDGSSMDSLPDAVPFAAPRPRKPWLLIGLGVFIIIMALVIIISVVRDDGSSSMEVDLDAPVVVATEPAPVDTVPAAELQPAVPVQPAEVAKPAPAVVKQPVVVPEEPKVNNATAGVPVRVIEDRKEVVFKPEVVEQAEKPVVKQQKPVAKKKTTVQKKQTTAQAPKRANWYVQFGSYSTRALAESAEKKIRAGHQSLFAGKQFVILAAVLPNGKTTYRLRIGFATSNEANGFCRNAKSDGVDCYVAK